MMVHVNDVVWWLSLHSILTSLWSSLSVTMKVGWDVQSCISLVTQLDIFTIDIYSVLGVSFHQISYCLLWAQSDQCKNRQIYNGKYFTMEKFCQWWWLAKLVEIFISWQKTPTIRYMCVHPIILHSYIYYINAITGSTNLEIKHRDTQYASSIMKTCLWRKWKV